MLLKDIYDPIDNRISLKSFRKNITNYVLIFIFGMKRFIFNAFYKLSER